MPSRRLVRLKLSPFLEINNLICSKLLRRNLLRSICERHRVFTITSTLSNLDLAVLKDVAIILNASVITAFHRFRRQWPQQSSGATTMGQCGSRITARSERIIANRASSGGWHVAGAGDFDAIATATFSLWQWRGVDLG